MSVNLTNAEIRQFELAGITKEMIGKTIERDRAAGLSDQDITLKASMKADQLEKENPALEGSIVRGGLRAISNLPFGDTINRGLMSVKALDDAYISIPTDKVKAAYNATLDYVTGNNKPTLRQYLEAPEGTTPPDRSWNQLYKDNYNELRKDRGETFSENYTKNMNKLERTFKEQNYDVPKPIRWTLDAAGTIGSYGLLPEGIYETVPRAAAFGALDAYQEGINKDSGDRAINALIGGIATGAVTGIVNKATGKTAIKKVEKEYPLLAEGFRKNPPKSTEEAVERITSNYVKNANTAMKGRVDQEATKLFSNMDNETFKSIAVGSGNKKSLLNKALSKETSKITKDASKAQKAFKLAENNLNNTLEVINQPGHPINGKDVKNLTKALEKTKKAADIAKIKQTNATNIGKLPEIATTAKPSTEGLTGGLTGFLAGNWAGGPVGGIVGALIGSRGKIGNALGAVGEKILGNSGTGIAKAMVNPQGTNVLTRALRKSITPGVEGLIKKTVVPTVQALRSEDNTSYKPSKKYQKTNKGKQTNNIPFSYLPNNVIVLPESNDSGESITQKHLQLIAALDPNFFSRTKIA
jgi:hypothetical protein